MQRRAGGNAPGSALSGLSGRRRSYRMLADFCPGLPVPRPDLRELRLAASDFPRPGPS